MDNRSMREWVAGEPERIRREFDRRLSRAIAVAKAVEHIGDEVMDHAESLTCSDSGELTLKLRMGFSDVEKFVLLLPPRPLVCADVDGYTKITVADNQRIDAGTASEIAPVYMKFDHIAEYFRELSAVWMTRIGDYSASVIAILPSNEKIVCKKVSRKTSKAGALVLYGGERLGEFSRNVSIGAPKQLAYYGGYRQFYWPIGADVPGWLASPVPERE